MTAEAEDNSDYDDFASKSNSPELSIKSEELTFPLSPASNVSPPSTPLTTWPYSALLTPQSLVTPSQLVLTDMVKRPASPASSNADQPPPAKRVKRKARTDEEKEARAYERTMRNRRAAQESRDRKKRQFEALEQENHRLHEENLQMKRRIEQLESQQRQIQQTQKSRNQTQNQQFSVIINSPSPYPIADSGVDDDNKDNNNTTSTSTNNDDDSDQVDTIIKSEVFSPESFGSTFHPAVVKFNNNKDLQCLSISLVNLLSRSTIWYSYNLLYLHRMMWMMVYLRPFFSTLLSLTTRIFLMNNEMHAYLPPATFNSLNTGSLFTGAESRLCGFSCH